MTPLYIYTNELNSGCLLFMDEVTNIKIVSYNCYGLKSSIDDIRNLCEIYDVIMLQETWLMTEELYPFEEDTQIYPD